MAHNHGSTTLTTDSSSEVIMMVPYFHFAGGDHLYFKAWTPTSSGAIVGACIGLLILAIAERWFSATQGVFETHWQHRALVLASRNDHYGEVPSSALDSSERSVDMKAGVEEEARQSLSTSSPFHPRTKTLRTIPPFIASHDIPRGILYGIHVLLGYSLMLAVMTFHAGYIISIIIGLGIGEVLFGRMGHGRSGGH
ncbi:Ctr copper transporter [Crucibulum laeve]|uniref:Copper transport protein n=1 Tax=Crucibulum laeve TaxID=68775 RepID=A0A5C3MJM1_9AGAR|nr:Ctr copper transporter [Crucibulum laeve]